MNAWNFLKLEDKKKKKEQNRICQRTAEELHIQS